MDGFAGSLDNISAASTSDVQDLLSALESGVQQREDEITVLKAALADVLRRIAASDDHVASVKKSFSSNGQPSPPAASPMPCITKGVSANRKPSRTSAVSIAGKETLSSAAKSIKRPSPAEKSHNSWENSDNSCNKLLKIPSTPKLIPKVPKNADKHKDVIINQEREYIKMFITELPSEKLKLEWDCRANVYLLPTREIIYFIASVVVLFNYQERTQQHYLGHTDCVKCLAIHPDKIRIATGQTAGMDKDRMPLQRHVRAWDSINGLGTFEHGVGCLDFSKAGSGVHLCVIDDSNEYMLTVWDWQKKAKGAEIKPTNEVVLAVEFHRTHGNTIIRGKSHIFFWTWSGDSLTRKQGILGKYEKPKFVQCLWRLGGVMLVWNKTTLEPTHGRGPKGVYQISKQIKATMAVQKNNSVGSCSESEREIEVPDQDVAEGKADQFLVGTSRNFILRGTFNDGFQIEVQVHTDELWGLATYPFNDLLLTCVCLWNSMGYRLEWTRLVGEPGHCADFHPSGTVVAIGMRSGRGFALDAETRDLVSIHTDRNGHLSVMRYSIDGTFLAVGSYDNFIYLYIVPENGKKYSIYGRCTGHSSYITHLDRSPDNKCIMSNLGDYEISYWDIPNGFQVFGVWPEGSGGTDISALVKVIAVADDFCKVHLFQYPCSKAKSAHCCGHVTNVTSFSLSTTEYSIADTTLTKTHVSSTESAIQFNTPTLPPSHSSPTLLEKSLEQIVEPSEDHSEEESEGGSEPLYEEPSNEISKEQDEATLRRSPTSHQRNS
uniref:Uncharacterized protein n=1 Tax=Cebus imitator TaxID=2715852 RepID=A0A2K5QDK0_CEBIM